MTLRFRVGLCGRLEWSGLARQRALPFWQARRVMHLVCLATLWLGLAQNIGSARAAFAVTDAGQHPLCALWSVGVHDTLRAQLQAGRHPSVRAFLAEIGAIPVHFDEAERSPMPIRLRRWPLWRAAHEPADRSFGRAITYLRVSVTDRCDLRCIYCMSERMRFLPRNELLSIEELDQLCAAFVRRGVRRLRFTGGEPWCDAGF